VEVEDGDVGGLIPTEALQAGGGRLLVGERIITANAGAADEVRFVRSDAHRWPMWWSICPEDASAIEGRVTIALDPGVLHRLACALGSESYLELSFSVGPGADRIVAPLHVMGDRDDCFGVVMPIGPATDDNCDDAADPIPCDIAVAAAKAGHPRREPKSIEGKQG